MWIAKSEFLPGCHAHGKDRGEAILRFQEAATKLIWLALRNITADWGRAANNWKSAMNEPVRNFVFEA